jgi:hypothetical protein
MMTAVMRIKKNRNRESDQKKMISAPISNKPIAALPLLKGTSGKAPNKQLAANCIFAELATSENTNFFLSCSHPK